MVALYLCTCTACDQGALLPQHLHQFLSEERAVEPKVFGQAVNVEPGYPVGHGTIIIIINAAGVLCEECEKKKAYRLEDIRELHVYSLI